MTTTLFVPPSWHGLKRQIHHLSEFGGSVQVVCGEAGAGKTSLIHELIAEFEVPPILLSCYEEQEDGAILTSLFEQLAFPESETASFGEQIVTLRKYAESLLKSQTRAIFVIDDAHYLSDATLTSLISVLQGNTDEGFGLHLLLFSEQGLAERIDRLQLVDVSVHDTLIPSFSPSEVKAWVDRDFSHLFPGGISSGLAQTFWSQSGGRPGVIKQRIDNQQAGIEDDDDFEKKVVSLPWAHIVAICLLVIVLVWSFWGRLQSGQEENAPSQSVTDATAQDESKRQPEADVIAVNEPNHSIEVTDSSDAIKKDAVDSTEPLVGKATADRVLAQDKSAQTQKRLTDGELQMPDEHKIDDNSAESLGQQNNPNNAGQTNTQTPTAQQAASQEVAMSTADKEKSAKPDYQASLPDVQLLAEDLVEVDENRLLDLSENGFVLQLMASSKREALLGYRSEQPNKDNLFIYRLARKEQILYVLVEGFYADKASALAAKVNLPPNQQKGGPWPKRVSTVHNEIRLARNVVR